MSKPMLQRGTNFSHWMADSPATLAQRGLCYDDFARMARYGADHIRLNISHHMIECDRPPYGLRSDGLAVVDRAIEWARRAGLAVILDLHNAAGMSFMTPEANAIWVDPVQQARFAGIWRGLAQRYAAPAYDHLAFELLNEPTATDPADWNHIARLGLEAVRAVDSERIVLIGSNSWNVPCTFPDLEDFRDPHVRYVFHWYEPFIFTHQRAPWVDHLMRLNMVVEYPTDMPDLSDLAATLPRADWREQTMLFSEAKLGFPRMEEWLKPVLEFRERTGAPVFCSEFGAYEAAPMPSRVNWYRDAVALFRTHDIGWSNWDYIGDFGIVGWDRADKPFREILFPGPAEPSS
ncbi:MAG TPA: cellulase family glycosylhydrolase [Armatimonadota bacterium]|nr:cellulase family glycosylhydrolase [Armatimonadota bacterium]